MHVMTIGRPLAGPQQPGAVRCRRVQHARCQAARPRAGKQEEVHAASPPETGAKAAPAEAGPAAEPATTLEVKSLQFPAATDPSNPVKLSTGLHRAPLSAGVKNATLRYDLPSPAVAVRNLVEQAQYAHLCTIMSGMHHRRAGYPFGTLVDFAADGGGFPIFSLSPLAIQYRNIMEDPRCSLVVQMPGWTGLANARVTIFGDVYQLDKDLQESASEIFHAKHASDERKDRRWVSGNAIFFRMNRILDIYFVGGFGTVQWVDVDEYTKAQPDRVVLEAPHHTLQVLNKQYGGQLRALLSQPELAAEEALFISIDKLGADIRVRKGIEYVVERVGWDTPVECLEDAQAAVQRLLKEQEARQGRR